MSNAAHNRPDGPRKFRPALKWVVSVPLAATLVFLPRLLAVSESHSTPHDVFVRWPWMADNAYLAACPPPKAVEFLRSVGKDQSAPGLSLLDCDGITPVIKPIAAHAGALIEVGPQGVRIDGQLRPRSELNPAVPDLGVPRRYRVPEGHVFLLSPLQKSFDSRYWGPARVADGVLMKPLDEPSMPAP